MKIELSVHANKLKNVAGAFKGTSDPFAIVTKIATQQGEQAQVLGKSEVIKNNLNPNWAKCFVMDYELGSPTKVAVSILDEVKKGENKSMGSAVFDIAEVLAARGSTKGKKVRGGGTIFLRAAKSEGSGVMRLQLKGTKLKNVEGFFSKSDPFFEIAKRINAAGGQTWDNIYRSEDVRNNLNPEWKEAAIEISVLCGGDYDMPVKIAVYDYESSGKHVPMGEFHTTANGLMHAANKSTGIRLKHKGKDVGTITVVKATVSDDQPDNSTDGVTLKMAAASVSAATPKTTPAPTSANFVDYIAGGCNINVSVAIDFTSSNGDPRKPGTLHHLSSQRNDYERAIAAIVSILEKYDTDKQFPVFGFGAKYDGVVRHCFQAGGAPEHHGVAGVLQAYRNVFNSGLIMSGPTVFTEVIQTCAARAKSEQAKASQRGGQSYTVLLILTDGAVTDVNATAECLRQVSNDPLSVVIVGIGDADFSGMQFLDDFSGPGQRDIVQFVEFGLCENNSQGLTKETLDEIPQQLTSYFQKMGIAPLPSIRQTDDMVSVEEENEIDLRLSIREDDIVVASGGDDFVNGFNAGR